MSVMAMRSFVGGRAEPMAKARAPRCGFSQIAGWLASGKRGGDMNATERMERVEKLEADIARLVGECCAELGLSLLDIRPEQVPDYEHGGAMNTGRVQVVLGVAP